MVSFFSRFSLLLAFSAAAGLAQAPVAPAKKAGAAATKKAAAGSTAKAPAAAAAKPDAGAAKPAAAAPPKPAAAAKPARAAGLYATIATEQGDIKVKLFEKESPITVKNFVDLAQGTKAWPDPETTLPRKQPLYNGLVFHRAVPGFMIQGGDPLANGTGGTKQIPDEFDPSLKFDVPGRLAMANAGPNTGSCQFFLTEVAAPHLNGLHTIFGQIVEGQELVTKIANMPAQGENPIKPVKITSITIQRVGLPPAKTAAPASAAKKAAAPKA